MTNTGNTVIIGDAGNDVGVSPGTAITGFPPGTNTGGTIHSGDAVALQAQADLILAYDDAAGRTADNKPINLQILTNEQLRDTILFSSMTTLLKGLITYA